MQQNVEATRINAAVAHERQVLGAQLGILREGLVHRIAVNAVDLTTVMAEVLGKNAGDQALADAPFSL